MEFLKKNLNYLIFGIIVILLILVIYIYVTKEKEVIKTFRNDGVQMVKIYTNKNPDKILAAISKETDSDKMAKKLEKMGVSKFIINNNGAITAGKHYSDGKYAVSIVKKNRVTDVVYLENESLYISQKDDVLSASIAKSYKQAKENATKLLKDGNIKVTSAVYLIDEKNKKMSKSFKKYLIQK